MPDPVVVCSAPPLRDFVYRLFQSVNAPADIAAETAEHLVNANLSGHDSHGVIRIPQYFGLIEQGEIVPTARPELLRERAVAGLIDAHQGLGQFATAYALQWAVERARSHGLASAAIRSCPHIGRLGEYTERAARQGFITIVTVGVGGPGMGGTVLFGSRQRFLGTNPWSISVPARGRDPMVFDGASSAVAEGKVRFARSARKPLPEGVIVDRDGRPTTDAEDFYRGGGLLPLGGTVAGHKGYGLAMASLLIGALSMIDADEPYLWASTKSTPADRRGRAGGVFLLVLDPACFGDAERYQALVSEVLAAVKLAPPAVGVDEILIPGEPEARMRDRRSREGIPIPAATWQELALVAERCKVEFPKAQAAA
jgi:hydroxycarboxylate dehydrogenase B